MALTSLKSGTECGSNWVKNRIYAAPAVKQGYLAYLKNPRRNSGIRTRDACMTCEAVRCSTKAPRPLLYSGCTSGVCCNIGLDNHPSKHWTFTRCCFNVGPASKTVAQHWNSIGWMSSVCWDWANIKTILGQCQVLAWRLPWSGGNMIDIFW